MPQRPPYTATDVGLTLTGVLLGALDLADMFVPLPLDQATRQFVIPPLSALLATVIVSFTAHRAVKHTVAALATSSPRK